MMDVIFALLTMSFVLHLAAAVLLRRVAALERDGMPITIRIDNHTDQPLHAMNLEMRLREGEN